MRAWRLLALASLIICSCSSQPLLSKDADALIEYIKASHFIKTEPNKACDGFYYLAKNEKFALADVAYVRSLQTCDPHQTVLDWQRPVPTWLEKEKQLVIYKTLQTDLEKGLFVQKNPQYFIAADRIMAYQKALATTDINEADKKTIQDSLYSIAPRFMPQPLDKDLFRIAKDAKSVRDFPKVYQILDKILSGNQFSFEEKLQARKEYFYTSKLQKNQNHDGYISAAKKWATFIKTSQLTNSQKTALYSEAQINYIRVIWTEQGTDVTLKELERLQKRLTGKQSLFELHWLRSRMFEEKKQMPQAVAEAEKALKEPVAQWRDKEKLLWSLAWSYYKSQKFPEAEQHFSTLIDHKDTSAYSRFKYMYWKAEALKKQNKIEDANSLWEKISNEDVFGYYNLLSHFQINMPLKTYEIKPFKPQNILSDADEKIFLSLQKVDETDLATRVLTLATSDTSLLKDASVDYLASFFYLHSMIGNYKYIFQVFNQLPYESQRDIFLKIPRLLFPEPHSEIMTDVAQRTQMEPELIYAIMRQESSFDPRARSPMDAFGLLQILPEVAKRVASENNIEFTGYEDLFDEKKNISIGTLLLKKQMAMFKNRFILYVASYNASSSAVRQWRTRYADDDFMFIEDIPYEETKAYVKLVFRNFILYKKLKHGDEFKNFPRDILDLREEPVTASF